MSIRRGVSELYVRGKLRLWLLYVLDTLDVSRRAYAMTTR